MKIVQLAPGDHFTVGSTTIQLKGFDNKRAVFLIGNGTHRGKANTTKSISKDCSLVIVSVALPKEGVESSRGLVKFGVTAPDTVPISNAIKGS